MAETAREAIENFLTRGYDALDENDPKYPEKLNALTRAYQQMVMDDANKVSSSKNDFEEKLEKKRLKFEYVKTGVLAGLATASGVKSIWAIKRSTEKEKDEAYLTLTDKTVMQDELREKQHWWQKLF